MGNLSINDGSLGNGLIATNLEPVRTSNLGDSNIEPSSSGNGITFVNSLELIYSIDFGADGLNSGTKTINKIITNTNNDQLTANDKDIEQDLISKTHKSLVATGKGNELSRIPT